MLAMKAFRGAGWLVASRFLGRFIDFFTLLIMARMLAPADFGLTALAMSCVAIVDMVLEVPVTQALVRLPHVDKAHLDTGFTLGALRGLAISVVLLTVAWPFAWLNGDQQLVPVILALAFAPIARGLASPGLVMFIRELGFLRNFLLETGGKLAAFCLAIATLLLGGGYWALVINFVAAPVFSCAISYLLAPYRPALSLSRLPDFASFVGWFTCAQFVSAVNWQFDRILLGLGGAKETLGRYAVAADLSVMPTQSLIGPALQPIMAAFARIKAEDQRLRLAFLKAARFSMLASVPCSLGIALTSDLIIEVLLGPKWHGADWLLSLLSLSVTATPYFQTLYSLSLALGRPEVIFRLNLYDLAIRSPAVVIGFLQWGAVGMAAARLVAAAVMAVFFLRWLRSLLFIGIAEQLLNLWKIAVAAAVMTAGVLGLRGFLIPWHLPAPAELALVAALGALLYGLTLLACGMWLAIGAGRLELSDRWWRPRIGVDKPGEAREPAT
ncbi:oligosaccharide flippase family protein [Bosea sp. LjRoot237]|uniref:oligosaccharide flippase family protein n=1 Tax=Bosea sp. LjRoot237 TaxID=3342292 RepID=UPI003ECF6140